MHSAMGRHTAAFCGPVDTSDFYLGGGNTSHTLASSAHGQILLGCSRKCPHSNGRPATRNQCLMCSIPWNGVVLSWHPVPYKRQITSTGPISSMRLVYPSMHKHRVALWWHFFDCSNNFNKHSIFSAHPIRSMRTGSWMPEKIRMNENRDFGRDFMRPWGLCGRL
jgi:hypothetical protein